MLLVSLVGMLLVQGEVVELYISHQGLKRYVHRLKQARDSYHVRLDILSSGLLL